MHWGVLFGATVLLLVSSVYGAPVNQKRGPPTPDEKPVEGGSEEEGTNLPYDKYLREVVMALEEDPEFRKKLEESNVSDIKDGSVAKHIELVSHGVRSKLDEIKRREIYRLQELHRAQMKNMQGVGVGVPVHVDTGNPHSFEMKDLEKLIKQTTSDLEALDEQRKVEFKEYEMEKEYEKREKLKHLDEAERKKEELKLEELKKKHEDHPKLNHPGSKDQFEEVWEKKDHLEDQEFNPKTFFHLHDIEGDGFWGIEEVEAVLQSELDKVYDGNNPEDDPMERFEEMNRMREHIFTEIDKDKDARISQAEFLQYTGQHGENEEFKKDEGWKTLDEDNLFTDEEYEKFLMEHHAQPGEINIPPGAQFDPNVQQMHQGQMPPSQMPQGQNLQFQGQQPVHDFQQQQNQFAQQQQVLQHQQQQFAQQQAVHQQMAQNHAQMQQQQQQFQQHQQQMAQQLNQQALPVQGQVPVQQQVQGQVPVQQVQGQVPVQQQQVQGQVPVQQVQGQVPVQQQQAQGQVPVQQQAQGQVPVQQQAQGQVPVQNQQAQGQVPVQQQQGQVPVQNQQQQQQTAQPTH